MRIQYASSNSESNTHSNYRPLVSDFPTLVSLTVSLEKLSHVYRNAKKGRSKA